MRRGPLLPLALLLLTCATTASAWVQSVEFPWNAYPRPLWETELVRLKNLGIGHISLPPGGDAAQLNDVIRIIRRLNMEADLEGPVPDALQSQTRAHGGPLTPPAAVPAVRISALAPDALARSRRLLASGKSAIVWTDVEDTLGASGYRAGAVNFAGQESPAATPLRLSAQAAGYWGEALASLHELPGAGLKMPVTTISVHQLVSANGASFVSVVNASAKPWTGDVRALSPSSKRALILPGVTVPARGSVWLPVNVPLMAGPLCRDCSAFSKVDFLVYATAGITAMEYENGILALEFSAPAEAEAVLQLSSEPSGPLVAGGKPSGFDWDEHTLHARLPIPKGRGPGDHVRIGLAIDAPESTGFFDSLQVLLIGETNDLTAEFSSDAIRARSRLRIVPELPFSEDAAKEPLKLTYRVKVPGTAIPGDRAEVSLDADGARMSHAQPQLLRPATIAFTDAVAVRVGANSSLPLFPATIAVNRRGGREIGVAIRNNAPEIRTYRLELKAEGLDFSPAKIDVAVGASAAREVTFRVFATGAAPGMHAGQASITGAAAVTEPVEFLVLPPAGAVAYTSGGFTLLESAKTRASFLPGRWLELLDKDNGSSLLPAGGMVFNQGAIEVRGDALVFAGQKTLRLPDLEQLAPKPKSH